METTQPASVRWETAAPPPARFRIDCGWADAASSPLYSRLLYNRGITTSAAARAFLNNGADNLEDPFLLPDMDAAVVRLLKAITNQEPVGIFGDFDVDGLTGAALLTHALEAMGAPGIPDVPNRQSDGHGLSQPAIEAFREKGIRLIVTVDTGSMAHDEIVYANAAGIDVIVTDHHLCGGARPPAVAVVNPHLAGGETRHAPLAGAGVAFKLAHALSIRLGRECPRPLLAFAALGTIADSAPLIGDNRIIAREGLKELASCGFPGLRTLLASVRGRIGEGPLDCEAVSFYLAPRLNAPGRMGDATPSLRLLTTTDPAEAQSLAQQLDSLNAQRQSLSRQAWDAARLQIDGVEGELPVLLAITCDGLSPGILGPLAGRLCAEHRRPAVVISLDGDEARGSARSVPEFDIHAALSAHSGLMTRFGGHARAAGFTVPTARLEQLLEGLAEHAQWAMTGITTSPVISIDAEVTFGELGNDLWDFVNAMGPFGEGNARPVLAARSLAPMRVRTMGTAGRHLRMTLEQDGRQLECIGFGLGSADLGPGRVDVACSLRTDFWNGRQRRELELQAIRPSL